VANNADVDKIDKRRRELQASLHIIISEYVKETGYMPRLNVYYTSPEYDIRVPRINVDVIL
jgi:hypothetical protein